ncbi:HNH endonuclease family protein [Micrococcus endophyticus]
MSIKRWISGAAVALAGVGLLGALGAGQLEDLSLDRVTVGGKIPGAEVLNDLVGTTPSPAGDRQAGAAPAAGPAAEQLELLPITEYRPSTAYAREAFGQRWADTDRNGCDQRNDVLRRDLRETVIKPGTHGCKVLEGTLQDPYTGGIIAFSSADPTAVQIDHIVSLSQAWDSGADQWSLERREQFANDMDNLLAVDGPTNQAKSDHAADEWLPASAAARCDLVGRQVKVKAKWGLSVSVPERAAMQQVLASCA